MLKHAFTVCLALLAFASLSSAFAGDKVYRVGVYENKPIIFTDQDGQYKGLAIDVLESLSKREGIRFEYVHGTWGELLSQLEQGKLDLLTAIAWSEERSKHFDYTRQTMINNWGVVYRRRGVPITSLEDLNGKRVALLARSIHSRVFKKIMQQFKFEFIPVEVKTYLDGLKAIEDNRADAAIVNRVTSLLNSKEYDALETGIIFNPVEVRMATPKGHNAELLSLIDKYIEAQKSNKNSAYHRSLSKWFSAPAQKELPAWLFYSLGGVGVIILLMAVFLMAVRRQVRIKTAELSESESRFRQLAENIREIFWISSPDWEEIYYISPIYEKIWGDLRENLYASPSKWIDFIHADDRKLVMADLHRKAAGDFSQPQIPHFRILSGDGQLRWISARAYPVMDDAGNINKITGVTEDITSRKEVEEQIRFMAMHDPLTHMFNRYAFEQHFNSIIQEGSSKEKQYALLYIDLDQFKIVNDTCGHTAGDKMLTMLADTLRDYVADNGMIARLGGDEFGIILNQTTLKKAQAFAEGLLGTIKAFRFVWEDKRFSVGASIGLVMIDSEYYSEVEFLSAADMACYAAKEFGRNRIHVFSRDDKEILQRHGEMQFVERINHALEEDRFVLHRQLISPLQDKSIPPCYEYLVRLLDEQGNLLHPGTFIPAAERYELMPRLDRWVVEHVFDFLHQSQGKPVAAHDHPVAFINLSGQAFGDEGFADFILQQAQHYQIAPHSICLEITETTAISNFNLASEFIRRLRDKGFQFALDDFGTGMSSFSYLKLLPVDFLKIDGVFSDNLDKNELNAAIIEAITNIGHKTRLKVIAEWIETQVAIDTLTGFGVDFGQGYAIGKPEPLPEVIVPSRQQKQ